MTGQDATSGESEDEPLFYGVAAKVAGIGQSNADLSECAPVAIGLLNLKMQVVDGDDTFGKLSDEKYPRGAAFTEFVVSDQKNAVKKHL